VITPERLIVMHPHKLDLNIMVLSLDIGVRMVCNIMFQLPEVYIASHKVQRVRENGVDLRIVRKRIVPGIVHDIKADCCKIDPQEQTQ